MRKQRNEANTTYADAPIKGAEATKTLPASKTARNGEASQNVRRGGQNGGKGSVRKYG